MSPAFFSLSVVEIIILVFGVIAIVWLANRVSQNSKTKRADTPEQNPQPAPKPQPQPSPQPERVKSHSAAHLGRPTKSRSFGCLFVLLGVSGLFLMIGLVGIFFLIDMPVSHSQVDSYQTPGPIRPFDGTTPCVQIETQRQGIEQQQKAIEPFNAIQPQLIPEVPSNVSVEISPEGAPSVHVSTGATHMSFAFLILIFLFILMPFTVLMVITIILIANRASRKKSQNNYYDAKSDSMVYQKPPRPPAQKMGLMPWVVVGMAFAVGFGIIAMGFFVSHPVAVRTSEAQEFPLQPSPAKAAEVVPTIHEVALDDAPTSLPKEPREIDVPLETSGETPKEAPKTIAHDKSIDELDAELEGSSASLLLESVLRAALKSFQDETPKSTDTAADSATTDDAESVDAVIETVAEESKIEKPVSAVRSLTRALVTELPEGIDENTALKSLGRFLGRAIASESVTRPPWVDQPSGVDPQTGNYRTIVTVGPYQTRMDCDRQRDTELRKTLNDYAELYLGPAARGRTDFSKDQLNELISRMFQESISTSVGPMVNVHYELTFGSKTRALLQERFRESLVHERIQWSGVALGCVSLFLLGAFAVLKFDPLYRRRTMIAIGVSVVILLGLGILVIA